MSTIVLQEQVRIPGSVVDLPSFRAWAVSEEFPASGRFAYLDGEVWVDMSPEELFTHNRVKGEVAFAILALLKRSRMGHWFHDRTLLSNAEAGLSTEPDGTFVSYDSLRDGRVSYLKSERGLMEVEGSPDIVLEVVSPSSVRKDTVVLRRLYWLAGVGEYWLVDARGKEPRFDLLRRGRSDWAPSRRRAGWLTSGILGKSVRLSVKPDELGYAEYTLEVR